MTGPVVTELLPKLTMAHLMELIIDHTRSFWEHFFLYITS